MTSTKQAAIWLFKLLLGVLLSNYLNSCLFFAQIEKIEVFDFFYLTKNNILISTNKTRLNLLITSLF